MNFLCFYHRFHENYKILKILPKAFCFNRKNEIYKNRKILPKGFCFNTNFNFLDENKYTVDSSILELVFWVKKHKSCKFRRLQEKFIFVSFVKVGSNPNLGSPRHKKWSVYILFSWKTHHFQERFERKWSAKLCFLSFQKKTKNASNTISSKIRYFKRKSTKKSVISSKISFFFDRVWQKRTRENVGKL